MEEGSRGGRPLTMEEVALLRGRTEAVSDFLRGQLGGHLETLRPIFAPRRLLGKHVRGPLREDLPGADRSHARLREEFARVAGRPFALTKELDEDPLTIEPRVELYPWEYTHAIEGPEKPITMTSPVRWVVSYRSGYTLSQLREALATRKNLRTADVRQFVINALALQLLLERYPEIVQLLSDLRYAVSVENSDELGDLPLVTISAPLPSFRPADDLIATAIRFSGIPAFIELIDPDGVSRLEDPLRRRIEAILA